MLIEIIGVFIVAAGMGALAGYYFGRRDGRDQTRIPPSEREQLQRDLLQGNRLAFYNVLQLVESPGNSAIELQETIGHVRVIVRDAIGADDDE